MTEKPETAAPTPAAFDPFPAFKPLAPAAWIGTVWAERMADLGSEITTFVAERIKEDVQTQHALLYCKSLAEVQHVQAEFLQKAFDQYQAETGKLVAMTGRMAAEPKANGRAGE